MLENGDRIDHQALLDVLVERRALRSTDLGRARQLAREGHDRLSKLLVSLGWVSEQDMAASLAAQSGCALATENDYPELAVIQPQMALRFMRHHLLIPSRAANEELFVIVSDPSDRIALDALRFLYGSVPPVKVGLPSIIDQAIEQLYGEVEAAADSEADVDEPSEDDVEHLKDLASEAPVIQLVSKIMQKAVEEAASDIHIEPFEKALKIRYRIDGVLTEETVPSNYSSAAVVSRVKIMAKMDIAERRLPQDGRIMVRSQGKTLDIRVSTLPTVHGESVVMRVLDRDSLELSFEALGFTSAILENFKKVLETPHGIILVTGPTGSGKSTSLYTAISHLNSPAVKIITVEDPVEYQIEGVNQLPVKSAIGLDFATALRSIMRQDPDIIMIGEMRDVETAKIAIQAALTGHLVLSTLHTNSASAGFTRLLNMGIENYLIISTISGILGQRLVRKLCLECREDYRPGAEQLKLMELPEQSSLTLYRAKGCRACGHSGYSGRTMLVEWLPMSEAIQALIMTNAGSAEIQQKAIDEGMLTMFQDGLRKVLSGTVCIDEVLRVTQQDS
ncbi:type II secretion system protein E (GspE) [Marinobacter gudaonensis]|uniref:Type II secretion system protein E n=1 Tax=Marinobacter gudaonensis TaxID=375760 RepID=A0A1I6HZX9_9GAMM|nr:type II secretion system ATPase GspE [Marinobacter gudaonensis]SFR59954.1 type II secretion system protein E (GspE) [Marinobacter gudaonensis]